MRQPLERDSNQDLHSTETNPPIQNYCDSYNKNRMLEVEDFQFCSELTKQL